MKCFSLALLFLSLCAIELNGQTKGIIRENDTELAPLVDGSGEITVVLTRNQSDAVATHDCAMIKPGTGALVTQVQWKTPPESTKPGTRLKAVRWKKIKDGEWEFEMEVLQPGNGQLIIFNSTELLLDDDVGVAVGRQDVDGYVRVLISSQEHRPHAVTIQSASDIDPPNRLDNFVPLSFDAESSQYLYGTILED